MKMFMWQCVEHLTDRWHHDGGLVVFAATLESARELLRAKVPENCEAFSVDPDVTAFLPTDAGAEVFIFPNAGCC